MAPMVAKARGELAEQSLTPDLPLIGMVRGSVSRDTTVPDRGRWILPVAAKAIDRVMSRKEAAILLAISESRLSALVKGEDDKSLSLLKLGALGDAFWIALHQELGEHFKLNDPSVRVQQAMDLVGRGMAMLVSEVKR